MEFRKFKRSDSSFNRPKRDFGPRRNEFIRVPSIQVIDQDGNNLGEMKTYEALKLAQEAGLDLVEVAPNLNPPVCKIVDYAKFTYEQKKKERGHKVSQKSMKEFKFSPVIDVHDKATRIRRAKEYLDKGHNVRLMMERRGRQAPELAKSVFIEILTNFADYTTIEPEPKYEGKRIFLTYKPNGKTKNKQNSSKAN